MARKKKYPELQGGYPDQEADGYPNQKADGSPNQEIEVVSKSQLKREMHELQNLGKQLLDLKISDRETFDLSAELLEALIVATRIKHREGLRRQMQFIGKLMRKEKEQSIDAIQTFMQQKQYHHNQVKQNHHLIEQWRDKILSSESNAIEEFLQLYPSADRQWLRQITRQSQLEAKNNNPAAARKLFSYIQELISNKN